MQRCAIWQRPSGSIQTTQMHCMTRGVMHGRLGQLSDAIDDFTAIIRAKPNEADAYKQRAEAWREMGHLDEAMKDLRRAAALDPSDVETAAALRTLLDETHAGAKDAPGVP